MKTLRKLSLQVAVGVAVGLPRMIVAAAPPAVPSVGHRHEPVILTVDRGKDITAPTDIEAVWNFGLRSVSPGDLVEHVFTFRNPTKASVTLDSLLTSCHCTTASIVQAGVSKSDDLPFVILPGKSVSIKVSVNVDQANAVEFRKMVWIYVKGRDTAAFTLTIAGTFVSKYAISMR